MTFPARVANGMPLNASNICLTGSDLDGSCKHHISSPEIPNSDIYATPCIGEAADLPVVYSSLPGSGRRSSRNSCGDTQVLRAGRAAPTEELRLRRGRTAQRVEDDRLARTVSSRPRLRRRPVGA